jgi:hypothetical protein
VNFVIVVGVALLWGIPLAAQYKVPDYPVRLTLRDSVGEHRLVGLLTSVTGDSLGIRVFESGSVVAIDRRTLVRMDRQRPQTSVAKAATVGCLTFGGVLGLAGSQAHDPDSPGIETALTVVGFALGCAVGGAGGAGLGLLERRASWEEIHL